MVAWRLRKLHVVGAGLLLTGSCVGRSGPGTSGDKGPPELVEASFVDTSTVRLRFSEPVTPQSAVDPSQFRLSIGVNYTYDYPGYEDYEGYTSYVDAGYFAGATIQCYEYCDYYDPGNCYEECYPSWNDPLVPVVTSAIASVGPDTIELTLSPGIDPGTCLALDYFAESGYYGELAMYVHYTDNGGQIQDTSGEALEAIAEHWALTNEAYAYTQGYFPRMDPRIPIPCPG